MRLHFFIVGSGNSERLKLSLDNVYGKQVSGTLIMVSDGNHITVSEFMCMDELKHEAPKTRPEWHLSCQVA